MMDAVALGTSLVLATCFVVSAIAALAARAVWVLAGRRLESGPPRRRAARLLLIRTLPALAGLAAALLVVAPAFIVFEPEQANEPVTATLGTLAFCGAGLLVAGLARLGRETARTRRIVGRWLGHASPLDSVRRVPAFRIRSAMPVVLLAGWFRPKVLVSGGVLDCCSGAELDAMIAHEAAHLEARDNLKRALMVGCADPLYWTRWSRRVEERWLDATEEAADDRAVASGGDPTELAGALLKVARLAIGADHRLAASAICRGERVARRVRRLLDAPVAAAPGVGASCPAGRIAAVAAAAAFGVAVSSTFPFVHQLIELVVATLP